MAFAKLFETKNYGQVLMTKEWDEDNQMYVVKRCLETENTMINVDFKFKKKIDSEAFFEKFDLASAEEFAFKVLQQIN